MPSASRKRTRAQSAARKPSAAVNSSTASDSALPDASPEPPSSSSPNARASDGVGHSFDHRRRALLHQLSPLYIPSSLPSLTSQHAALYDLLDRSLTSKANAAALLIGHSGCGKSALTRSVLLHLQRRHAPLGRSFLAVQLSGRLHSDDTVAMREVVRQLTVDLEIEKPSATADFNTLLQYLRDILASSFTSTPVFFVLDHFDLFAAHKAKQTLLYNLCNLLQEEYQLAIIGITQRVDCFELLEKRIKSRLSARRLHFTRIREEEQLLTILRDRLFITAEGLHKALGDRNPFDIDFVPGEVESGLEGVDSLSLSSAVQRHNETVEAALQDEALRPLIQHHMQLGKSVRWFLTWLTSAVCRLTPENAFPTPHLLIATISELALNPRKEQLKFCSVVEWCILVCVMHVERKQIQPYNYAILYDEYSRFAAAQSSTSIERFSSALFLASFERLLARGVLVLEGSRGPVDCSLCLPGLVDRQFLGVRRGVGVEELDELLSASDVTLPQWVRTWALKEVTA